MFCVVHVKQIIEVLMNPDHHKDKEIEQKGD
jgi:hypothetical protein